MQRHKSVRSLSKLCSTHRNIHGWPHQSDSSVSTDATLYKWLTSGQERRLRDPNCRHLDAMVSELKVQDSVLIDGGHFTEVERSYVVLAVGTEHHWALTRVRADVPTVLDSRWSTHRLFFLVLTVHCIPAQILITGTAAGLICISAWKANDQNLTDAVFVRVCEGKREITSMRDKKWRPSLFFALHSSYINSLKYKGRYRHGDSTGTA